MVSIGTSMYLVTHAGGVILKIVADGLASLYEKSEIPPAE